MNKYAKIVMFIGFFLIAAQVVKNWSVISATLFSQNPSSLKVPGPGGIPPNPVTHKCPGPTYTFAYGKCWSPATPPVPPPGQGVMA